jgi:RNA polymerase sigma-70 factor (ECF subfamily)
MNAVEHCMSGSIPTRWSLLGRLKDWEDQDSWREFVDTYSGLVRAVALKAGLSETEAEDVVQDTFVSVAKSIGEFRCDPAAGSFKAWLLKLTRWRILNQLRKRMPVEVDQGSTVAVEPVNAVVPPPRRNPDEARTATIERVADPGGMELDRVWDAEWARHLMEQAKDRVRRRVSAPQFQMFELYGLQGWPLKEVARPLRVSAGQVYLARHRVGRLFRAELRKLEGIG